MNYRDHKTEMSSEAQVDDFGFFLKAPSLIVGLGATVFLPYTGRRFDQEGQLAVIIGTQARKVDEADALDHVFGYTTLLDMTMRGGEDRSTRKSFETFTPIGPWIVTADEFGDPDSANLRCWVNSALRRDASTADLIWNVARLVSYASWVTTLELGDIVEVEVEVEVDRIGGRLGITVFSNGAVESHTLGHGKGPVPLPPPADV